MNPDPCQRTAADATAEKDVRAAVSARAEALASGDVEALASLMHPECVWTTHAGLVLRRDEYIRRNTRTVTWRAQRIDVEMVVISNTTAVVVGTVEDTVVEHDEDAGYRMRITMVWIHDRHWRLLAAHAGPRI
jgi:uncharacterized protein (TIGR02246 family)